MRLLLALCLGLGLIALQVVLGVKAFYPETYADKTDEVDELILSKKSLLDQCNAKELTWIKDHPVINVGVDPSFYPLETFDERGRYTGLGGDYLRILRKLTGLDFRVLRLTDWASTEESARNKQVDMFMAAAKTGRRSEYMLFTAPYINMPGSIMTRRGSGLDKLDIADLKGRKVAVVNNYSWHDFLTEFHPEIEAVPVRNTLAALQKLANGDVDAVIDYEFNLVEKIQTGGIMQVQNAGKVDSSYGHSMAVRKDLPQLFDIVSKALNKITPQERLLLAERWLQQERPAGQERHLQWIFFFILESSLLCLALLWLWKNEMRKQVAHRTRKLEAKLAALKKA